MAASHLSLKKKTCSIPISRITGNEKFTETVQPDAAGCLRPRCSNTITTVSAASEASTLSRNMIYSNLVNTSAGYSSWPSSVCFGS